MIPVEEILPRAEPKDREEEGPVQRRKSRSELFLAFAQELAKEDRKLVHSWEIDALLYDEYGLPK
jgi:hypothetical protein